MGKSLTETAKAVLLKEGGVPSVSASDNDPDRGAKSKTPNMETLHPGTRGTEPDPKHNDAEDLGGATPTQVPSQNLGARAAGKVGKDTSRSGKSSVAAEAMKKIVAEAKAREVAGEPESIEEELDLFIDACIQEGLNEDEIAQAIAENFEFIEEDTEVLEEEDDVELSEELETFIATMIDEGFSEDEIAQAIEENFEMVTEDEEETIYESPTERVLASMEDTAIDMSEDVDALLEGEQLSEEFRDKAKTIFEGAVVARLEEEVQKLEVAYLATLEEEVQNIAEQYKQELDALNENINDYLVYVTEEWMAENEVAIDSGLRTELTEDFIAGLRNLFAEHYIDIPEDKVEIVEEMGAKLEDLQYKLNEEIEKNVELTRAINESRKYDVVDAFSEGLTATQAEKLKTLSEGLEYVSEEDYVQKVQTLRENYFPGKTTNSVPLDPAESPGNGKGMISEDLQGPMAAYVKSLGKTLPK